VNESQPSVGGGAINPDWNQPRTGVRDRRMLLAPL